VNKEIGKPGVAKSKDGPKQLDISFDELLTRWRDFKYGDEIIPKECRNGRTGVMIRMISKRMAFAVDSLEFLLDYIELNEVAKFRHKRKVFNIKRTFERNIRKRNVDL